MKFIKDSVREFKHVVWPTREETKKYFVIVLVVLILFGLYLFIANTIFSKGVFGVRDYINPSSSVNDGVELDLDSLLPEWMDPGIMSDEVEIEVNTDSETTVEATEDQTGSTDTDSTEQ